MVLRTNEPLLKLALKNEKIVSINEVENGKDCACICPKCKSSLVAKNNVRKRSAHFAHSAEMNCIGAVESAVHLLAKEVLKETNKIYIPHYKHYYHDLDCEAIILNYNRCIVFDSVKLKEKISIKETHVVADALCEINGKKIIIEFAKSHFIDEDKNKKLAALGIACLEPNFIGRSR